MFDYVQSLTQRVLFLQHLVVFAPLPVDMTSFCRLGLCFPPNLVSKLCLLAFI